MTPKEAKEYVDKEIEVAKEEFTKNNPGQDPAWFIIGWLGGQLSTELSNPGYINRLTPR